jgi:hypothetical protein
MFQIQKITTNPYQKQTLILDNGLDLSITLYFAPMQFGWFIRELLYPDFELRGIRVTNSPNILNQWRNLIPFGLACFSTANREPSLQDDFVSGASKLYILSEEEVQEYAEYLTGG